MHFLYKSLIKLDYYLRYMQKLVLNIEAYKFIKVMIKFIKI